MRGIMVRRVPKTQARVARCRGVQVHHAARILRGGHRESARSGDADDGEGAEVDSDEPVSKVYTDNGIMGYSTGIRDNVREMASWERGIWDHGTMGCGIKCWIQETG